MSFFADPRSEPACENDRFHDYRTPIVINLDVQIANYHSFIVEGQLPKTGIGRVHNHIMVSQQACLQLHDACCRWITIPHAALSQSWRKRLAVTVALRVVALRHPH